MRHQEPNLRQDKNTPQQQNYIQLLLLQFELCLLIRREFDLHFDIITHHPKLYVCYLLPLYDIREVLEEVPLCYVGLDVLYYHSDMRDLALEILFLEFEECLKVLFVDSLPYID